MGRKILVTPEELAKAAERIDSLAQEYSKLYGELYSETNAMASTWSGKDNLAFTNQIDGFKDDFEKMHALLGEYSNFLKVSANSYSETQNTVAEEARKLTN